MECRRSTHVHLLCLPQAGGDCKGEGEQPAAKTAARECQKLQQATPHEHQPAATAAAGAAAGGGKCDACAANTCTPQLQTSTSTRRPPVWEGGRIGWCCARNQTAFRFKYSKKGQRGGLWAGAACGAFAFDACKRLHHASLQLLQCGNLQSSNAFYHYTFKLPY